MDEKKLDNLQKLREQTGAGVMDCRGALLEAGGDFEKAVRLIREKGLAKAVKRADRAAGAGFIESYIHNERIGVLLDLRAETDFVVRSEPFRVLAHELAMQIAASDPQTVDELLSEPYMRDEERVVSDIIKDTIARVGENIKVNRFYRIEL